MHSAAEGGRPVDVQVKTPQMPSAVQKILRCSLRWHYPVQVKRSTVTTNHPLSPVYPSSRRMYEIHALTAIIGFITAICQCNALQFYRSKSYWREKEEGSGCSEVQTTQNQKRYRIDYSRLSQIQYRIRNKYDPTMRKRKEQSSKYSSLELAVQANDDFTYIVTKLIFCNGTIWPRSWQKPPSSPNGSHQPFHPSSVI